MLLFKEGVASFSLSNCDDCVFKQPMSEFSDVIINVIPWEVQHSGNTLSIIPLFLNLAVSFSNDS